MRNYDQPSSPFSDEFVMPIHHFSWWGTIIGTSSIRPMTGWGKSETFIAEQAEVSIQTCTTVALTFHSTQF